MIDGDRYRNMTWGDHDQAHRQMRVGTVTTSILETAVPVTFDQPMPNADYEVFIQPKASVGVNVYPSNLTSEGFELDLSAGAAATYAYFAVSR